MNAQIFWSPNIARAYSNQYTLANNETVEHPSDGEIGALVRNNNTFIYMLYTASGFRSVPPDWADENAPVFADAIREARTAAGLTQQQLSDKSLIPLNSIKNWEGHKRKPPYYVKKYILENLKDG